MMQLDRLDEDARPASQRASRPASCAACLAALPYPKSRPHCGTQPCPAPAAVLAIAHAPHRTACMHSPLPSLSFSLQCRSLQLTAHPQVQAIISFSSHFSYGVER